MPHVGSSSPYLHLSLNTLDRVEKGELVNLCVTDLGTNSFHSIVLSAGNRSVEIADRLKQPVSLGSDGLSKGYLSDSAIERAVQAMLEVRDLGRRHGVDGHLAIATSAVRESANSSALIGGVKTATGIEIDVISGIEEAYLIYKGVTGSLHLPEPAVLVDIGGGSTEITIASSREIISGESYPLGAARLTELFVSTDPISVVELMELYAHLEIVLGEVVDGIAQSKIHTMVGSSGTLENLARIAMRMPMEVIVDKEFGISAYQVEAVARELVYSERRQREKMKYLSSRRVDQIVAGAALVAFLIERTGVEYLRISPFALREGVMLEYCSRLARGSQSPESGNSGF